MSKEVNEKACFLDMPNGLEDKSSYLQKFVKAPKFDYPMKASSEGKEVPVNNEAMKISLGC
jgi:hypothetical protein